MVLGGLKHHLRNLDPVGCEAIGKLTVVHLRGSYLKVRGTQDLPNYLYNPSPS